MTKYRIQDFPHTRIATIDISELGKQKHHLVALIEVDVTKCQENIKIHNKENNNRVSFTAWLVSVISRTIKKYDTSASYLVAKNKLMIFEDINVSIIVEKELHGQKVPIPVIIEKANESSAELITRQIENAKNEKLTSKDIVLMEKTSRLQRLYYKLPGFMRRWFWRYLLRHPKMAYKNMGNVAFTSVGMMGKVSGWFIPISIHPISIGVSSIVKKPVVIDDKIEIREMLNMTILLDHDVIDGAPMARFVAELTTNIEYG